ncbi:hypothetical protein K449DRAFT_392022 [Hypoxylon sp. EC38]|nr:hypothetical protein K449DRAFT_392022 [Hypoxylon sp. EC38]OTA96614.1 hypothetical protein M434DRAFT_392781 [Hypoxylon sp. CO27-5]
MFRRFWAGPRGPAATTARLFSFRLWSPRQSYQSFFARQKAARPELGPRPHQSQSRILRAAAQQGIYGSIFMSIAMLVTDTTLDYKERQELALKTVYDIITELDEKTKLKRYWETGLHLLGLYSGAEIQHHGRLQTDPQAGWRDDELETWLLSTPDPDYPGWTFVFCQALLHDLDPEEVYIAQHGNRATDATEALLPAFEDFARDRDGPVRGVILLMQPNGDWKSVYFDGKRWINVVYLEWQTPATLGYES